MARFAIIQNGVVANIVEAEPDFAASQGWVETLNAGPGDSYADGVFTPKPAEPVPSLYREMRAAEYPPMADYLDGIVKGDQAQVQAYIDACQAVKLKYPKPMGVTRV